MPSIIPQQLKMLKTIFRIHRRKNKVLRILEQQSNSASTFPSLVVTGPPRIGKSFFCSALSSQSGASHVELDTLSMYAGSQNIRRIREQTWRSMAEVLEKAPFHGFILDSAWAQTLWSTENVQLLEGYFSNLRSHLMPKTIVVLSKATAEQRLEALKEWRETGNCWTLRKKSDGELPLLAERIVARCNEMAIISEAYGLTTVWIEPQDFEQSVFSESKRVARLQAAMQSIAFEGY